MTDQPASPALPDDELRETLDLLSTVIASVSDRVDSQTVAMDRLIKTATEARQAAFAARAQTDPKQYGELIATKITQDLRTPLNALDRYTNDLRLQTEKTQHVLKQMKDDRSALYALLRSKEIKAERLKHHLPWYGLGAAVLALALSVTLPRFYASNATTCTAIGAEWTTTTQGGRACVFFGE